VANHKSSKKRIKTAAKARLRNRSYMSTVRKVVKNFKEAAEKGSEESAKLFQLAQKTLAKAGRKGVLNRKTASRKISRLSKMITKAK